MAGNESKKMKESGDVQQGRKNLRGGSDSQVMIWIGVGLIAAALVIFGFLFFSKGKDDSSSQGESSSQRAAESSSQRETVATTTTAGTTQKETEKASGKAESKPETAAQMQVHFIDCGQGDCTLITCGGEAMLIDSGELDDKNTVINYIRALGVSSFKYVVVTHPHTDHMGEMPDILKAFKAEKFIMPKVPDSMTPTIMRYEKLLKQVKAQGLTVTWSGDETYKLGSAEVKTFTPKKAQEDLNNYSTLVKVTCGGKSVLITGDCEKAEEQDIMSQGFDLKSDILKVAHHGSYKGTTYEFLETVVPSYAVISCGKDNDYGHPHDSTMKRLKKKVKNIYITKDNGTVVFDCSGSGITVKTQR